MCPGRKFLLTLAAGFLACSHARAQDAGAAEQASQAKPAPINFQVLKAWELNLGNHSIRYNRVAPPLLPVPPPPVPPAPPPTAEQIAAWEALQQPRKKSEVLFLSATVYDRKVTEIRWFPNQRESQVFSNIDFNFLAGLGWFETEDTEYMLLMGIGNETSEQVAAFNQYARENGWPKQSWKQIPALETFSRTRSEYVITEDERHSAPPDEDLAALDALHVYYDANKQRLMEEYVKRETTNAERARWLKEHPPVPKNTVINYWKKSAVPAQTTTQGEQR